MTYNALKIDKRWYSTLFSFFFSAVAITAFFMPVPAGAGYQETWQTSAYDFKVFNWAFEGDYFSNHIDFDNQDFGYFDLSGFSIDYYDLEASTTPQTAQAGFFMWVIADFMQDTRFYYSSGGSGYINYCNCGWNDEKRITLPDKTLRIVKCGNFDHTPFLGVRLRSSYTGQIYGIFYTSENLFDLINDYESLYNYIQDKASVIPESIQTRIINLNYPAGGETTATTTINFSFSYYYNSDYTFYDRLGVEYTNITSLETGRIFSDNILDGQNAFSTSTILFNGGYTWRAFLYNSASSTFLYSTETETFNVIDNPYEATSTPKCADLGFVQEALCEVFVPDQSVLQKFTGLKDLVVLKPPFGYFALIKSALSSFTASATPVFTLATLAPVVSNFFDPLKTGLSVIIWLMFGFWLYRKISTITL